MNPYSCTLYNCKSLNRLQQYLFIQNKDNFKNLGLELKDNPLKFYRAFEQNGRNLFQCSPLIIKLHKRLMRLFNIEKSSYLKSGIKHESNITNAELHKKSNYFLLLDIKGFYPSITKSKIKTQLIRIYHQSSEVAEFIANLVTVPQINKSGNKVRALVTGSPLSQYFTYVINKKMLDELAEVSAKENIRFSVYVDDITFSSKQIISYRFHTKVYSIIKKYGYLVHEGKVYRGKIGNKSIVTGVKITKHGFILLDKHKSKIRVLFKSAKSQKEKNTLLGLIHYSMQIHSRYSKYKFLFDKHCT